MVHARNTHLLLLLSFGVTAFTHQAEDNDQTGVDRRYRIVYLFRLFFLFAQFGTLRNNDCVIITHADDIRSATNKIKTHKQANSILVIESRYRMTAEIDSNMCADTTD